MIEVVLVDIENNERGTMEKMKAHKKAELHRAVSLFVFNSRGEWLLQRRAKDKYHSACLWTNTCCGHPLPGESNENAALRRLRDEMGMECEIEEIFHFVYKEELEDNLTEHELDYVFMGVTDTLPIPDSDEVDAWKYISFAELEKDYINNPECYTVWFGKIFKRVNEIISKR